MAGFEYNFLWSYDLHRLPSSLNIIPECSLYLLHYNHELHQILILFARSSLSKFLMYHQQQNNWYPQSCLLAHFESTLYFSRSEFTFT